MIPHDNDTQSEEPVLRPADAPDLGEETDGSMWASLFSNLRDAFSTKNEAPLQLESKPVESDLILHEEGVFGSLWSSVRDVFFPVKLPPLQLESQPDLDRNCSCSSRLGNPPYRFPGCQEG